MLPLMSVPGVIVLVAVLWVVLSSFFTVATAEVKVVARFGKFLRVAEPGLNWKVPLIDAVQGRVSLRVEQIKLTMETKTRDNVFVSIPISVQTRVRPDAVYDAFYKLAMPEPCSALDSASASARFTTRIFSASPRALAATCSRWAALMSFIAALTFSSGMMSVTRTLTIS